jgi:hypothetical protein
MVVRQEKPINEASPSPPKGRLTWIALIALIVFAIVLIAAVARPLFSMGDGPEGAGPEARIAAAPSMA